MIAVIGTVISGTMQPGDLIPAFTEKLKELDTEKQYSELIEDCENFRDYEPEEQEELLYGRLWNTLDSFAPQYCFFGSHIGNGSDYGFWVSESMEQDFDGKKVSDLSEVPEGYEGEILLINDHGNMTLYFQSDSELKEIWSVV